MTAEQLQNLSSKISYIVHQNNILTSEEKTRYIAYIQKNFQVQQSWKLFPYFSEETLQNIAKVFRDTLQHDEVQQALIDFQNLEQIEAPLIEVFLTNILFKTLTMYAEQGMGLQ